MDKNNDNLRPNPRGFRGHLALSKVSAIGCLHSLSREEEACISMALIPHLPRNKKIVTSALFEAMPKCSRAGCEHGPILTELRGLALSRLRGCAWNFAVSSDMDVGLHPKVL